ncbi:MAG TPA: ATP-binding protein, partial [Tepidisphaeraceae bacterium]|nr:ATP-binding protein [Tepidisphaeraceae bacterium]
VLESDGDVLRCRGRAGDAAIPLVWPIDGSLAGLVVREPRTAYVDDLHERADLAEPASLTRDMRSMIACPIRIDGRVIGAILLMRRAPGHWSRANFRFVEWLAAEMALAMETLNYRRSLRERTAEVETANRKKDEFLAMLSHELRTPLTPVLAAAGSLRDDPRLPEDVRDDLAMIGRNVAVQSRLVDDLLDLARLGKGKLLLHPQELDPASVIQEAARIVAPDLDAKELTLEVALQLPNTHAVNGDGARLQQVIWNLLRNAIKFSAPGGRIRLTASANEDASRARIDVIDRGAGIDPADLDRIFMPFEQVSPGAGRADGQGLGLGLCIARAIVELHGGAIRAESAGRGQGARFTVELPLIPAPRRTPASEGGRTALSEPITGVQPRILFVEDHEDTARLMVRYLGSLGYAVQHAPDSAAAVASAAEGKFDLIISDLGLPDGNGIELMRQLRDRHPTLTGICLSGFGMESDVLATREAGFAEHLTKPIELPQLRAAIQRVLAIANG